MQVIVISLPVSCRNKENLGNLDLALDSDFVQRTYLFTLRVLWCLGSGGSRTFPRFILGDLALLGSLTGIGLGHGAVGWYQPHTKDGKNNGYSSDHGFASSAPGVVGGIRGFRGVKHLSKPIGILLGGLPVPVKPLAAGILIHKIKPLDDGKVVKRPAEVWIQRDRGKECLTGSQGISGLYPGNTKVVLGHGAFGKSLDRFCRRSGCGLEIVAAQEHKGGDRITSLVFKP